LLSLNSAWGATPSTPHATSNEINIVLPSALNELSLTVKEGYDTNVFGTTAAQLPGRPDVADVESWTTVINPRFALNLLPWIVKNQDAFLKAVNFAYVGEGTLFSAVQKEDNWKNTFGLQVRGKSGPWSLLVDDSLLWVVGPKDDPYYSSYSPLGYRAARDRRNQFQERNASYVRYDGDVWFVRGVANALYYNLKINEHNPVGAYKGYLNWINRDDINTGLDFGYKLTKDFAFVAGWRVGQQTQARTYYSPIDNSSTYNRALFGFEGKPWSWLQIQVVAGPDFRRYGDGHNVGIAHNRDTWLYTESSLTATLTAADSLSYSNKVWHWVSATGATAYQETTHTWSYRHAFTRAFSTTLGFIIQGARYDAPTVRNDWTSSYSLGTNYAFSPLFSVGVDFLSVRGRSNIPPTVAPGRDWNEQQTFVSLKLSR
jgi:hypothetical protein